ncbi:thioredoxin domain-containing protein 11-like [Pollicipes pollicipes]|nr:thioredoxin domain-containing protein 11-like [Pollicipes pollicipes]
MSGRRGAIGARLCFVMGCAFTVYAAVSRGPLLLPVVPAQPAVPFFGPASAVTDYFTGDLTAALRRAAGRHATLLFFYAPWDHACRTARPQLERLARATADQVDVLAVNCWHVSGSCRKDVKKVTAYPLLVLYLRHGRGLQYSGPLEAARMVRFVERALRPLVLTDPG